MTVRRLVVLVALLIVVVPASATAKVRVQVDVKPAVVGAAEKVTVTGKLTGKPKTTSGVRVRLQRQAAGRFSNVAKAALGKGRRYSLKWTAPANGEVRMRVRATKRGGKVLASSKAWTLTVRGTSDSTPPAAGPIPSPTPTPTSPPGDTLVVDAASVEAVPPLGGSGTLRLSGDQPVKPNDVLAAGVGPSTPTGFLLRATAVRSEAGDTVVEVVQATLREAIPEAKVSGRLQLEAPARSRSAFKRRVDCSNGGEAVIEGTADLGLPALDYEFDWGIISLNKAAVWMTAGPTASASASVSGAASCTVGPIELVTYALRPVTFTIGPVPVVVVPEIEVNLSGKANVEAAVATSLSATATVKLGAKYEDGSFDTIKEFEKGFDFQPPAPTASATLGATVSGELEASFYGLGGPEFSVNLGPEVQADLDAADPWWTLDGVVSLTAKLEIDKLDLHSGTLTAFERRFRLAEAAPREPRYRIVAGWLHSVVSSSGDCVIGEGPPCTASLHGQTDSFQYSQSTDATFHVNAPTDRKTEGDFRAPASIDAWTHAYQDSSAFTTWKADTGYCEGTGTTKTTDSGLRHPGGLDPSMYSLIGTIVKPAAGEPATRPGLELRVDTDDRGNLQTNQPALGITWPYSSEFEDSLITTSFTATWKGNDPAGCAPAPSTIEQSVLARHPFDPLTTPFGEAFTRTEVVGPLTYGAPRCTGNRCLTRISGTTGFDDVQNRYMKAVAKNRTTWWFDVETCVGCPDG